MTVESSTRVPGTSLPGKNAIWRQNKLRTAAKFFALGLLGLVLPVIPGLLLIGYAMWLIFPAPMEKFWQRIKPKI
ncbi:MAG: hypothetical protein ACREOO_12045 [bacterium]